MKHPFDLSTTRFDAKAISATIARALASAGLDPTSGPMRNVTGVIERALSSGVARESTVASSADDAVIDVAARVVGDVGDALPDADESSARVDPGAPGEFETHRFTSAAGSRAYRLYVPRQIGQTPAAMVVMLHGCTQSASDFAAGTRMNRLADEHGFLVLYPEQAANANASRCWNWFQEQDQLRDSGEPSLIAAMVREVAASHGADSRRIFVAGLSAGAAMAVILGRTYPDLFAGVGAHSGLPYASAHDVASAMAAMKGGRGLAGLQRTPGASQSPGARRVARAVPTIVFHGDRDHTVQQSNGAEIVQQASNAYANGNPTTSLRVSARGPASENGRSFSRTDHVDDAGRHLIEEWTLHGAGHAWSGGDASGSFTDSAGPDASAKMVEFFLSLPRAGIA
ncbi:MAG TPA: PHB depolymerase family esterase [Caldimonas sp.]|nr:PHB depolymerase family esterase [Caldimonas sp.]